jgi:hypothetical protein
VVRGLRKNPHNGGRGWLSEIANTLGLSASRQPATADWTVATIKLAMEQEPEGDIEAMLNYVACKAKHRFGVRLRVTRASPGDDKVGKIISRK